MKLDYYYSRLFNLSSLGFDDFILYFFKLVPEFVLPDLDYCNTSRTLFYLKTGFLISPDGDKYIKHAL